MTDEVKEILSNPKVLMLSYGSYISVGDFVKLKDCITLLQEENEELKVENEKLTQLWLSSKEKTRGDE